MRLLLIVFIVAFALPACEKETSDEAQIRALVTEAVELAEKHDSSALVELTANEFVAEPGNRNRQDVSGILLIAFRRYGQFEVKHPDYSVSIDENGRDASATIPFLLVKKGQQNKADFDALSADPRSWVDAATGALGDPYTLEIEFKKLRDEWKVNRVRIRGIKHYNSL